MPCGQGTDHLFDVNFQVTKRKHYFRYLVVCIFRLKVLVNCQVDEELIQIIDRWQLELTLRIDQLVRR